jgi:CubicO group peptidase (beta-lactamase class C family)
MLLSGVVQAATRDTVEQTASRRLFAPLGITVWDWQRTPQGETNTGWGLHLRPVDMLKIGQLYLQGGQWEGERILSAGWIDTSTQPLVHVDEFYNYGYQWWRFADGNEIVAGLAQNDLYFAWGFGGNFIFVVPHLDLIVVTTAENFENSERFIPALRDYIFPTFSP